MLNTTAKQLINAANFGYDFFIDETTQSGTLMSIRITCKNIALVILLLASCSVTLMAGKPTLLNHQKLTPCIESIYQYNFTTADSLCSSSFSKSQVEFKVVMLNLYWWKLISGYNREVYYNSITAIFQDAIALDEKKSTDTQLFLAVVAGIFQLRADSYMGKKTSAMRNALRILPYYKKVLANAPMYDEFTFLAGIYNYGLGAIISKHPLMFPAFFVFPDPNPTLGYTQLISCEKRGNLLLQQESCYFRYKIGMEIREEPQLASTIAEQMSNTYPSNPILALEKIKALKKTGKPHSAESYSLSTRLAQHKELPPAQKLYFMGLIDQTKR